ncbi:App1 family protein [Ekhidna sp.]|uniref:App1 family protein n=1 Tax=Ekhidna sp. TaxID=2608089 RepID=UPI003C79A3DD
MLGIIRPPTIVPYRGYGNKSEIVVSGHVLENRPDFLADVDDKKRKNFRNMIARYMSTSLPEVEVGIHFHDQNRNVTTDELGFFQAQIDLIHPLKPGWHQITYTIADCKVNGEVLITDQNTGYGVISDIDDTVLISHATQLLRKLRLILTKNAKTRLPFPGVKDFYCALVGNDSANPIFYVSSSEWNLYDFLVDFFETRELPKGPFLLQRFKSGLKELIKSGGGTHMHKQEKIEALMEFYPNQSFVLIGDSGQRDPEIYAEIVRQYPGRIKAIYIRTIRSKKLDNEIENKVNGIGVSIRMVEHTDEAYRHAQSIGLISEK